LNKKESIESIEAAWLEEFGQEGQKMLSKYVDEHMERYLYLKSFALKV
jgi:hypothetical protein